MTPQPDSGALSAAIGRLAAAVAENNGSTVTITKADACAIGAAISQPDLATPALPQPDGESEAIVPAGYVDSVDLEGIKRGHLCRAAIHRDKIAGDTPLYAYIAPTDHAAQMAAKDVELADAYKTIDANWITHQQVIAANTRAEADERSAEELRGLLETGCQILDRAVYGMTDALLRTEAERFLTSFKYGDALTPTGRKDADPAENFCDGHCTWTDHHPACAGGKDAEGVSNG